ncbi:MAG: M23 family metallopeptidase [Treponema sp.]|nr:M23 family metallopeptidase [Treponema sp.]
MKKAALIIACLLTFFYLQAEDLSIKKDSAAFEIKYSREAFPGDAQFVRMTVIPLKNKKEAARTKASLTLLLDGRELSSSDFYRISGNNKKNNYSVTLLAAIPLSTWWDQKDGWTLKIKCSVCDSADETLELPMTLLHKEFISETLWLDGKNTSIKTDVSPRRQQDIEKLNAILAATDKTAVWQTAPFKAPVSSNRRTSFFADRRIYKYNTGGSTTGLHHGIDYGVPEGTEVHACARGKVVLAEDRVSTGYSVVIEHLPGLYSLYYHMSRLDVKEGDITEEGQLIGLSGYTGLATGPHLHWEMRLYMQSVSPDYFLGNFTFE